MFFRCLMQRGELQVRRDTFLCFSGWKDRTQEREEGLC